jgi:hypothetical protein
MVDLPFVIGSSVTKTRDEIPEWIRAATKRFLRESRLQPTNLPPRGESVSVDKRTAELIDRFERGLVVDAQPSKPKPAPSPKPKAPKETYEKVPRGALNRDYWERKLERAEKKAKPDEASELKHDRSFVDGIWRQANAKGVVSPKAAMNFLNQMGVTLEEYHSTMGPNAPYHAGALLHYMKTGSGFYLM